MDRNSAIGLTLIGAILLAYFYWFAPTQEQQPAEAQNPIVTEQTIKPQASTEPTQEIVAPDSVLSATYGDLSTAFKGDERKTEIETNEFKISLSNKGGVINYLELKNYKTYTQQPLVLVEPNSTSFSLKTKYKGETIDLYNLYYTTDVQKLDDTTKVSFTLKLSDNAQLKQTYWIPNSGFEIKYDLQSQGLEKDLSEQLTLQWNNFLRQVEKDIVDNRNNTTITYLEDNDFDELTSRSSSTEKETLTSGLQWVTIKQKFFLRTLIGSNVFSGGEIETSYNEADTSVVKRASVTLTLKTENINNGINLKYFFGPNDYHMIGDVAPEFQKNVYLGWPPVYWINKFVVFPIFNFLTNFIGNFGLIIIILVIAIRLILLPLSYRSYLSMAKMRVLKPELDEIKEKHGDDMSKVQQEQLKLYQQVGVNPISGCIPLLLQMPILFAMFYLFPNSIELRQQSFLWAEDLSTYDSILNLPFTIPFYGDHVSLFTLLMTASTLVITWQNNQISSTTGPMKSMSYIMPLIFLFVLNSFPSGLSYYYLITNLVTFGQQAIIKKFVDEDKIKKIMEENRKKNLSGGGKKSKFMSKLEEAMKASEESRRKSEEERKRRKNQQ